MFMSNYPSPVNAFKNEPYRCTFAIMKLRWEAGGGESPVYDVLPLEIVGSLPSLPCDLGQRVLVGFIPSKKGYKRNLTVLVEVVCMYIHTYV